MPWKQRNSVSKGLHSRCFEREACFDKDRIGYTAIKATLNFHGFSIIQSYFSVILNRPWVHTTVISGCIRPVAPPCQPVLPQDLGRRGNTRVKHHKLSARAWKSHTAFPLSFHCPDMSPGHCLAWRGRGMRSSHVSRQGEELKILMSHINKKGKVGIE